MDGEGNKTGARLANSGWWDGNTCVFSSLSRSFDEADFLTLGFIHFSEKKGQRASMLEGMDVSGGCHERA